MAKSLKNNLIAIFLILVLGVLLSFQVYQMFDQQTEPLSSNFSADSGSGIKIGFRDWNIDSFRLNNISSLIMDRLFQSDYNTSLLITSDLNEKQLKGNGTYSPIDKKHEIKIPVCQYDFKVFVYELPSELPSVKIAKEARKNKTLHVCHKCIFEQFSLEYIIHDFFTQFCGRTFIPDEADFFYLPIIRDAEYRLTLEKNNKNRAPSSSEWALINMIENNDSTVWNNVFKVTDKYWHRKNGGDHIIVMAAPVTNFRHESSKRGFFHYMSHLSPPIFIGVEYSLSFVKEYPICSVQKNLVLPYPTTDVEFFNGKLLQGKMNRSSLFFYAGGLHGDCIEIRRAMHRLVQNCSKLDGLVPKVRPGQSEREHGFRLAKYCPVPIGDSPSSKRMYDVLNFGCVPIVLSDDLIWAFSEFTNGPFYHKMFALHLPQVIVQFPASSLIERYEKDKEALGILPASGTLIYDLLKDSVSYGLEYEKGIFINALVHILKRIPDIDYTYLKYGVDKVAPHFHYYKMNSTMNDIPLSSHYFPDGGAMNILTDALSQRKKFSIEKIYDSCIQEKNRMNHRYVSRYPCHQNLRRLLDIDTNQCIKAPLFDRIY